MSSEGAQSGASTRWTVGFAVETALTLIVGGIGAYEGYRLAQEPLLWKDPVGPGWFLFWVSVLMIVLGLVRIRKPGEDSRPLFDEADGGSTTYSGQAFRLLGVFAAYVFLLPLAGYEIATFLFFTAALKIAGFATWRYSILVGLLLTAIFYFFALELNIYLP